MQVCLLASVPHTGTNYLFEFFRRHCEFEHVVQLSELAKTVSFRRHWSNDTHVDRGVIEGRNLVWSHFHDKEKALLFALATAWPAVVPVRDPLLSLCSKHNRMPGEVVGILWRIDSMSLCNPWRQCRD